MYPVLPLSIFFTVLPHAHSSPLLHRQSSPPAQYTPNPSVGPGSSSGQPVDSAHFRVYNTASATASATLNMLEAAHQCFVTGLGWRTPGLSYKSGGVGHEVGPWYKMNVYQVPEREIPGAAAQTWTDQDRGLAFLKVVGRYMTTPGVVVHEFGHAMHYSEKNWIDQTRTGAWWETIANYIADTYIATSTCTEAKRAVGVDATLGDSPIEPQKILSDSFQVLVDATSGSGNYYQAFPFLSYITANPDNYPGLGPSVLLDMIRKYKLNSNETPLHTLERLLNNAGAGGVNIQKVVGQYWARMAYVDIGHAKAQAKFQAQRSRINYANWDNRGNGRYAVKSARAPRYMGANITPLIPASATATVGVQISVKGGGGEYTATLAVTKGLGDTTRYVDVVNGRASVKLENGEEVSLVVANTPAQLIMYDPFSMSGEVNRGLGYEVVLEGAMA